jgi:hypothetical protein
MLLTMKNNDRYSFLSTVDFTNKKHLGNYRKEFLSHVESRLHDEYDRGYFEAWSDYMKILPRIEGPAPFNNKNAVKQAQEETETQDETVEAKEPSKEPAVADDSGPTESKPQEKNAKPAQSLLLDYAK